MQEIIAISVVFYWLLVILHEKVKLTSGGEALLRSSRVQVASLGLSILISCLLHARRWSIWVTRDAFVIVNQQGPRILRLRMNSSSIDC